MASNTSVTLAPGDGFLFYTDGFYDVVNPAGVRLDFDAFARCVEASPAGPASGFLSRLLARLQTFADGSPFTDDLAALAGCRERT